jgi:phosphoribosylanthranilate isomerase
MSLWIKICGNTTLSDTLLAVDAGADAVGFIFAPSPRRVTTKQVAQIAADLHAGTEKIGVFVDADFQTIADTVEHCGLNGVQLHFQSESKLAAQLRERFGADLRILRVIHFAADASEQLQAASADTNIDGILVDSRTATAVGGTGIAFDWNAARGTVFQPGNQLKLIAAGGLNPANVSEAIQTLHPWGVDVVSGVESSPGHKDAVKVREFVANVRATEPTP